MAHKSGSFALSDDHNSLRTARDEQSHVFYQRSWTTEKVIGLSFLRTVGGKDVVLRDKLIALITKVVRSMAGRYAEALTTVGIRAVGSDYFSSSVTIYSTDVGRSVLSLLRTVLHYCPTATDYIHVLGGNHWGIDRLKIPFGVQLLLHKTIVFVTMVYQRAQDRSATVRLLRSSWGEPMLVARKGAFTPKVSTFLSIHQAA